jgi:CubicO group peptidase (beta-lactamase class C family)
MKHAIVILSFLLYLLLSLSKHTYGQTIRKLDDGTVSLLNSTITSQFNSKNLKGLGVGVIYGGEIVYTYALGNATSLLPFTTSTKTVIASVSKTVTALMAMRMVQNGDIALNDPITDYVPFPGGGNITIRHLLSHQSGIGHYDDCGGGYNGVFNWNSSMFVVMSCSRCVTPPGSARLYTTFGTTLLGSIIEKVGLDVYGRNYRELYSDWIRTPGGLTNMTAEYDDSESALANGYTQGGSVLPRGWSDIGWRLPAGGFVSDITDLTDYGRGIIRNTFVNATTAAQMRVGQTTSGSPSVSCGSTTSANWGLGFVVNSSGDDLRIWHNGLSNHGYSSLLYLYPIKGAGIVLICNNDDQADALMDIRQAIEDMVICPSSRNFTNSINWSTPRIYEADLDITIDAPVATTSGEVILDAGRSVIMKPGFEVTAGKTFRAVAEGCAGVIKPYN